METATARGENGTTLFLAFELSNKNWKLGFTTGLGQKPRERTIPARDLVKVAQEIAAAKRRFRLPESTRVVSCYEAGRDGFWLHRALMQAGVDNRVVDSSSIEVKRRARRAKTDRLDLGKLITMLIRYHGGESKVWSVVHVPDAEEEDRRQLHRDLADLKAQRAREVNRVKGLLASQGIAVQTRGKVKIDLDKLRLWDGSPIPEGMRGRIRRAMERLDFLNRQIQELDRHRAEALLDSPRADVKQVRSLVRLRGIGPNTSWVMVNEFFGWRKFRNRRQVGALAGLAPTPYQRGTRPVSRESASREIVMSEREPSRWRGCGAIPTRQRAESVVPGALRAGVESAQAHRHRGVGEKAPDRALEISRDRRDPGGRHPEGVDEICEEATQRNSFVRCRIGVSVPCTPLARNARPICRWAARSKASRFAPWRMQHWVPDRK